MRIDAQGLLIGGEYISSPNCDDRPAGPIELLVIHNISLPPGEFGGDDVRRLFTNTLDARAHPYYLALAGLRVSAHFLVRRDGRINQFVPCTKRAWHAGESCWQGRHCCNDFSLGIELEGSDTVPYTNAQYDALHRLTKALRRAYPIRGIAGHRDIAPQRKTDPGACFDWSRYLAALP
ncbi:MAG: N-acetyl-anhydromuranmyl-L-alanine amidase [Gallionellales bacterium RIFCSPLOWO2_12_FULL_59_22]|nr:MAG: N-acetyl-anhydromuranmyl-L-alanine amidase [Gallionellales bacterium RIFCSPLOWO2_02_FULL_59_110]OGT03924.1 MAG: N-acetyl-anhydromuranmyl-L-alanine amidase [Gallionellales bacterium RIFCSPLOWO2_02_58_13]OGT12176.1 MAG: N-acetyl-anhydromuranmyl-L-alanine amidase [Gallionellales bacterium RIFCSPLOWO2_12_FULL_59_22]